MPMRPLSSTPIIRWKSAIERAEQRLARERHIVEMERAHRRGALSHLVFLAADPIALLIASTRKTLKPRLPSSGAVRASTTAKSATGALWIHNLPPLSRQPCGCLDRPGLDRGHIRTRLGFCDRIGTAPLALEKRREIARCAARACRAREQRPDELDEAALVGDRRIAARKLLHDARIGADIGAGSAHLLGHGDAEHAELCKLRVKLALESVRFRRARPRSA